jgi:hypothetical protein
MASKIVEIVSTAFTQLDTGAPGSELAIDMQNNSDATVTVVFAATLPAVGTDGYLVKPGQGVVRNGHTGSMWARTGGGQFSADVVVGE